MADSGPFPHHGHPHRPTSLVSFRALLFWAAMALSVLLGMVAGMVSALLKRAWQILV